MSVKLSTLLFSATWTVGNVMADQARYLRMKQKFCFKYAHNLHHPTNFLLRQRGGSEMLNTCGNGKLEIIIRAFKGGIGFKLGKPLVSFVQAPVLSLIADKYVGFRSFDGQTSHSVPRLQRQNDVGVMSNTTYRVAESPSLSSAAPCRSSSKDQTDYRADVKRQY